MRFAADVHTTCSGRVMGVQARRGFHSNLKPKRMPCMQTVTSARAFGEKGVKSSRSMAARMHQLGGEEDGDCRDDLNMVLSSFNIVFLFRPPALTRRTMMLVARIRPLARWSTMNWRADNYA